MKKNGRTYFFISFAMFLLSLTQDTFYISGGNPDAWSGGFANLTVGLLSGQVSWFANPLIFISWILTRHESKFTVITSLLAVLLCLQFLSVDELVTSEAGHTSQVTTYFIGYWLWLGSAAVCLVAAIIFIVKKPVDVSKVEVV